MSNISDFLGCGNNPNYDYSGSPVLKDYIATGTIDEHTVVNLRNDGTVDSTPSVRLSKLNLSENDKILHKYELAVDRDDNGILITINTPAAQSDIVIHLYNITNDDITYVSSTTLSTGKFAYQKLVSIGNNKFIIVYRDNDDSYKLKGNVITVSSGSVSIGTTRTMSNDNCMPEKLQYDSTNDKTLIIYKNNTSGDDEARVISVSGTTLTFGSMTTLPLDPTDICYDSSNDRHVLVHKDGSVIGTISGTSISFGSIVAFPHTHTCTKVKCCFDSVNNKIIIVLDTPDLNAVEMFAYTKRNISRYIGTVSGSSITYSTLEPITALKQYLNINYIIDIMFDHSTSSVIILSSSSNLTIGKCTGTDIKFNAQLDLTLDFSSYDESFIGLIDVFKDAQFYVFSSNRHSSIQDYSFDNFRIIDDVISNYTENKSIIGVAQNSANDGETVTVLINNGYTKIKNEYGEYIKDYNTENYHGVYCDKQMRIILNTFESGSSNYIHNSGMILGTLSGDLLFVQKENF